MLFFENESKKRRDLKILRLGALTTSTNCSGCYIGLQIHSVTVNQLVPCNCINHNRDDNGASPATATSLSQVIRFYEVGDIS